MTKRLGTILGLLVSHGFVRGGAATKFAICLLYLGTQGLGDIAITLAALAIVEAVTDSGGVQALIQQKREVTKNQLCFIQVWNLARGIAVASLLYFGADYVAKLFGSSTAAVLLQAIAPVALLRGLFHPGFQLHIRAGNFKPSFQMEFKAAAIDIVACALLLHQLNSALAVPIALCAAEAFRLINTWAKRLELSQGVASAEKISALVRFGRWIWLNNVLTVSVNQLDKAVVGRIFGNAALGEYFTAQKIVQLFICEIGIALATYMFTTFSAENRNGEDMAAKLGTALRRMGGLSAVMALALSGMALFVILQGTDGSRRQTAELVLALVPGGVIYAITTIMVSYTKAIGAPHRVTTAVALQLILLAAGCVLVQGVGNIYFFVAVTALSQLAALLWMHSLARIPRWQ